MATSEKQQMRSLLIGQTTEKVVRPRALPLTTFSVV